MDAVVQAPAIQRLGGWPEALAVEVAFARRQRYELGVHDCLRFTCRCIEAMTGHDFWPRFAGYTTRREALKTIRAIAPTLGEAVGVVLGVPPAPTLSARRGDVVLYRDAEGEHLGVCVGPTVAVLGADGLLFIRLGHHGLGPCWRVG